MNYKEKIERLKKSCYGNAPCEIDRERLEAAHIIEELACRLEATIQELKEVAAAVDDLSDFIDDKIHPIVSYDMYTALRENADSISIWHYDSVWDIEKEEQ